MNKTAASVAQQGFRVQTVPYLVILLTMEKNVSLSVLAKEVKPVTHLLVVSYRQQQQQQKLQQK
eukprot:GAHX01003969.1.p2 GENE.GAHX01003969.1~~GAHX01003969.1.p2  ORF type:complete len:64 (+),score=8.15 GAHX01003969.1:42-233(+)